MATWLSRTEWNIFLVNIRSWNCHFEHILVDMVYSTYSSLFSFTGLNIIDSPAKLTNEILDDWKDIHENTQLDLALCYNVSKLNIIKVIDMRSVLEVSPVVLKI